MNYPPASFPFQQQEAPGLAGKMIPRPDHGEEAIADRAGWKGAKHSSRAATRASVERRQSHAREGADVAINYLPAEQPDADEVIKLIEGAGRKAVAIPGDIRDEGFCKSLVHRAAQQLGGLDIIVNNAAKQHSGDSILDLSTEQLDATLKTNVYAMFWITKAAVPRLRSGAAIINTSSVRAYGPSPNLLDYAQTKSAIVSFTKSLAKQLADRGIRVNAVAPGPFWTPLQVSGGQPPSALHVRKARADGTAWTTCRTRRRGRLAASNDSSYATGQVYGASGGGGTP